MFVYLSLHLYILEGVDDLLLLLLVIFVRLLRRKNRISDIASAGGGVENVKLSPLTKTSRGKLSSGPILTCLNRDLSPSSVLADFVL